MAAIDPLETLSNAIDGNESRYAVHGSFALDGLTPDAARRRRDPAADARRAGSASAPLLALVARRRSATAARRRSTKRSARRATTSARLQGVGPPCDSVLAKITTAPGAGPAACAPAPQAQLLRPRRPLWPSTAGHAALRSRVRLAARRVPARGF